MSLDYWPPVKRALLSLSFVSGLLFGVVLIFTPVLGDLTPFSGLEWTGIGILWLVSVFWEFSTIQW